MPDSNLNITVTTDSKALQDLVTKLNAGTITVKEFSKTVRDLKSEAIPGSQALKDLGDVAAQVSMQSKSVIAQERTFTNVIRESRQERRLYRYAMLEGVAAVQALTGKEDILTASVTNGAQAVFGMKFALDAMGVSAKAAWPVAIIVAAWTVISGILSSHKKAVEDLNKLNRENLELQVKLGLIDKSVLLTADQKALNDARAKLKAMQDAMAHPTFEKTTRYYHGETIAVNTRTSPTYSEKEIADQLNIVLKLQDRIKTSTDETTNSIKENRDAYKDALDALHQAQFNLMDQEAQRLDTQKQLIQAQKDYGNHLKTNSIIAIQDHTKVLELTKQLKDIDEAIAKSAEDVLKAKEAELQKEVELAVLQAENNIDDKQTVANAIATLKALESQTESLLEQNKIEKAIQKLGF